MHRQTLTLILQALAFTAVPFPSSYAHLRAAIIYYRVLLFLCCGLSARLFHELHGACCTSIRGVVGGPQDQLMADQVHRLQAESNIAEILRAAVLCRPDQQCTASHGAEQSTADKPAGQATHQHAYVFWCMAARKNMQRGNKKQMWPRNWSNMTVLTSYTRDAATTQHPRSSKGGGHMTRQGGTAENHARTARASKANPLARKRQQQS